MPVILSTLVILIAAIGCWFLSIIFARILFRPYSPKDIVGFRIHGIVPAVMPGIAGFASRMLEQEFLSPDKIAARLNDPALMQQLKPEIETHVDQFLQIKLKEAFPLLSGFMGEKTVGKFKAAFLTEIETILPELLRHYTAGLMDQWQPAAMLAGTINNLRMETLEKMVQQHAAKQLRQFHLAALLLGILIGVIQVALIHLY